MKICFKDDKEQAFYEDSKALSVKYGTKTARMIIRRINELKAAMNPQKLPKSARFHEHDGKREGLYSVDLDGPRRLILMPLCDCENYWEITEAQIYEIYNPH